ncbi:MAG: hypothetical protein HY080_02775 [Gammaproteobacteria bacterium]|nr:hypothetical protein [Gammaproteobacteria bacterium]
MKYSDIQALLPDVYQRSLQPGYPLDALLHVMVGMFDPCEAVLERIDTYFSPYSAPDDFVRYLARWVDLDRYLAATPKEIHANNPAGPTSIEPARLRELIAKAAHLSQWRGTARGLRLFLETATGIHGFKLDETTRDDKGRHSVFHLRIQAPKIASRFQQLITTIINGEKPAYVTYELEFNA